MDPNNLILGSCLLCNHPVYLRNSHRTLSRCHHTFHRICLLNYVTSVFRRYAVHPNALHCSKFFKCPTCNKRMNMEDRNWVFNDGSTNVNDDGYSTEED